MRSCALRKKQHGTIFFPSRRHDFLNITFNNARDETFFISGASLSIFLPVHYNDVLLEYYKY